MTTFTHSATFKFLITLLYFSFQESCTLKIWVFFTTINVQRSFNKLCCCCSFCKRIFPHGTRINYVMIFEANSCHYNKASFRTFKHLLVVKMYTIKTFAFQTDKKTWKIIVKYEGLDNLLWYRIVESPFVIQNGIVCH